MNKLANVLYAYKPKNSDELELEVDDKIEVIGFEEEGWWRGRLKNRIGVFPSNFVQVIETGPPNTTQPVISSPPVTVASQANKLNLFSNKTSKTSLSANSLNSSNNNSNNISNNNSNNLMMNNTQHQESLGLACNEDPSITSSERRPKPIRGVGYGDIFASGGKSKPLPADPPSNISNERLSTSLASTLQKQIPKKPPPPAPVTDISNGTSSEQAPALPPKPANQFSPHLQHPISLSPAQQQQQHQPSMQQVREQAKVIFAYEPLNDDELAMEVGDIIDIIDKDIEDAGWWKGELRGKVGVFPDNFVKLIGVPETPSRTQDWPLRGSNASQTATPSFNLQTTTEGKIKSVFASTPKGFSKQLENNLEKHNSPASFLSLKRNKLQQQTSTNIPGETTSKNMNENGKKEADGVEPPETNTTKLNHITANRAKGPSRRPPSNILNKRNQIDQVKRESNGRDDQSPGSLPLNTNPQPIANDSLSSLPSVQHATPVMGQFSSKPNDGTTSTPIKPSLSLDNVIENQTLAPKTSQRVTQVTAIDKNKAIAATAATSTTTTTTTTPPWMVELKKAHAEKKRDTPLVVATLEEPNIEMEPEKPQEKVAVDPTPPVLNSAQYDSLVRQISKNVTSEISELREEVKRLQEDFQAISELKSVLEVMKVELKTCQSATENQKRYIKELVNNLADERKKIAAMQSEIDRTLK